MLSRFGEWLVAKGHHCRVKGKGTKKKVGLTREILKKKKKKKENKPKYQQAIKLTFSLQSYIPHLIISEIVEILHITSIMVYSV